MKYGARRARESKEGLQSRFNFLLMSRIERSYENYRLIKKNCYGLPKSAKIAKERNNPNVISQRS